MEKKRVAAIYDYALGIVSVSILVTSLLLRKTRISNVLFYLILIAANIMIHIFMIRIGKVTSSLVPIIELSALIIFGIPESALIQLITVFVVDGIINRRPLRTIFLNVGLIIPAMFVGGRIYYYLLSILGSPRGSYISSTGGIPAAAYFIVSMMMNYLLIYIHFALLNIKQFKSVFLKSLSMESTSIVISIPLALTLVGTYMFSHDHNTLFAVLILLTIIFICYIFSLSRRLMSANNQLKALSQVAVTINSYLDLEKTCRSIINAVDTFVDFKGCYIFEANLSQAEMKPLFYRVESEENPDGYRIMIKGTLMESVCSSKKPLIIDKPDRSCFTFESGECSGVFGSCILLPMRRLDACVGCIGAFNYEMDESDTKSILEFLMILSDQATIAIENARLYMASEERASTDGLTHLFNHRYFYDCLEEKTKEFRDQRGKISLILFDIDHFKMINDRYGHTVGDYVLKEVAVLIKNSVRKDDIVSRYGGEEFAVILPGLDSDEAYTIAERIRIRIQENDFVYDGCHVRTTISGGISEFPLVADNDVELVNYADRAMYDGAKYIGRNRIKVYDGK